MALCVDKEGGCREVFPTSPTLLTNSEDCAKEETFRYISRVPTPSGLPLSTPRIRTIKQNKQESFTITSAHIYNVPAHILGSLAEP